MKKTLTALALATTALAATGAQAAAGDIIVRMRAVAVSPTEDKQAGALTGVGISDDVIPELDITYMATNNIGLELIAGTSMHTLHAGATKIATTYVLPPTLTLQYHFAPEASIRPYVGVGVNYTIFYKSHFSPGTNLTGVGLSVKDSFGVAAQAGVDIDLNKKFFLNLDVKYITMKAKAYIPAGYAGQEDVNPLVFGIGFGTRF